MTHALRLAAFAALAALVAQSAAAQQAPARIPPALTQAVAATQAAKAPYVFDFDLDTKDVAWRTHYDPNTSPKLRLVEPSRDSLDNDQRRGFDRMAEQMEGVSWCASEGMVRVANVQLVREDADTATYSFQPTRESIRGEQARQYADRLRGELTLTKTNPDITRVRLYTPARFSPLPLVNVDHVNVVVTCAEAPNGRRYAAETVTEMRGSAFGQAFNERTTQRMHHLRTP